MDLKYGFIVGIGRFFFMMSIIDGYDRCIVGYHVVRHAVSLSISRRLLLSIYRQVGESVLLPYVQTRLRPVVACTKSRIF